MPRNCCFPAGFLLKATSKGYSQKNHTPRNKCKRERRNNPPDFVPLERKLWDPFVGTPINPAGWLLRGQHVEQRHGYGTPRRMWFSFWLPVKPRRQGSPRLRPWFCCSPHGKGTKKRGLAPLPSSTQTAHVHGLVWPKS